MSATGSAMKCRLELSQLARRHGVTPGISCALPLAEPSSRPVQILGVASSCTVDQERMKFRPWSLTCLSWRPPQLLFRHKEPAGKITKVWNDDHGRLLIEATIDHPEAARCGGLSVAATIRKYELRDVDDPQNYHALILEADLDEISLTPTPCNPDCLITSRLPAHPTVFFDNAKLAVEKCIRIVETMQMIHAREPEPRSHHDNITVKRKPKPRVEPHRVGSFGSLVAAIERNHHVD